MLKEVGRAGLLNNLAAVKYDDAIGYIGNNTQVMSYYHDAHSVFASQLLDQICACIVTSRAVVGSSASRICGLQASAIAIMTLWRIPPDNWCG